MKTYTDLKKQILAGAEIDKEEAFTLCSAPIEELCQAADEIREHFRGSTFDMCTIINGKCGRCPEDCKYCAQSAHYVTKVEEYPLLSTEEIVRQAEHNAKRGVLRYSIVTSGRKLSDAEVGQMCQSIQAVREKTGIEVCVSFGLLGEEQFGKLREAGVSRVHCNLETSRANFPSVCTTHTFEDKIETIRSAQRAGLDVCSGGIMGLGETMEDRIDMALELRELGVDSVPVNFLNPIAGTPYEHLEPISTEEKRRILAVYRFLLPRAFIRLAGGRGLMEDKGEQCFKSGANAAISGDMLTTAGITVETDLQMLERLGYQVRLER